METEGYLWVASPLDVQDTFPEQILLHAQPHPCTEEGDWGCWDLPQQESECPMGSKYCRL